jgi:hypothetical protein
MTDQRYLTSMIARRSALIAGPLSSLQYNREKQVQSNVKNKVIGRFRWAKVVSAKPTTIMPSETLQLEVKLIFSF